MRAIDADQLIKEIEGMRDAVIHAHWVDMEGKTNPKHPMLRYGKGYGMCSNCEAVEWLYIGKAFCPYCGAMLDEEENE